MKSKLHLVSILFFLLHIRLENCHSFCACCEHFIEWWMAWTQLGSVIIRLFPCSWMYPHGRGVPERNNLLTCFISFDVTEQKNLYQMMTKGGRCCIEAGFIYNWLQWVLSPSLLPPNSHQYHQSREKEERGSDLTQSPVLMSATTLLVSWGRWNFPARRAHYLTVVGDVLSEGQWFLPSHQPCHRGWH